eukprot:TRINITY_DN1359_c0_g2_i1.p1 TRINITY_DN1359_c0_g2~~TRINITY_DN1359_c0_g2_i1.p1  ORF type:complete len:734 (-),score=64.64 TRINITY_DN1359_c0_g2_i1:844-2757(-)
MEDYGRRMYSALGGLQTLTSEVVESLLHPAFVSASPSATPLNATFSAFRPESIRSSHDVLPERVLINLKKGGLRRVVVYNSLETTVEQVVSIVIATTPGVAVLNSRRECIPSQLSPVWDLEEETKSGGRHRLFWRAVTPPLGLETYWVGDQALCGEGDRVGRAVMAEIEVQNPPKGGVPCPSGYKCVTASNTGVATITNEKLALEFSSSTGLLRAWTEAGSDHRHVFEEELATYTSRESGAYVFRPLGPAVPRVVPGGFLLVSRGPLVEEVLSEFKYSLPFNPLFRAARLYKVKGIQGSVAEMFHRVSVATSAANSHELVLRYKTGVKSGRVFYSDLNGYQMARREYYPKIPVQGHFYPMPQLAFLHEEGGGTRFSVHTRQAVGVASLQEGWLEMMLERRMTHDDGKGLLQGVTDNHPTETTFHLLLEHNTSTLPHLKPASIQFPSLLSHRVGAELNYPLALFIGRSEEASQMPKPPRKIKMSIGRVEDEEVVGGLLSSYRPMAQDFPCDIHMVNLKHHRPLAKMLVPDAEKQIGDTTASQGGQEPDTALVLQRWAWESSFDQPIQACEVSSEGSLALSRTFSQLQVSDVQQFPLNLVRKVESGEDNRAWSQERSIRLEPMDIKAFKFQLELPTRQS